MNGAEIEGINRLIDTLYDVKSDPNDIMVAQERLQLAQKSETGWILADYLLNSSRPEAQFLGAVTVTIRLHDQSLPPPVGLRQNLLTILRQSVANNNPLAANKLITTLSLLFFRSYDEWLTPIQDICSEIGSTSSYTIMFCKMLIEDYGQYHSGLPNLREKMRSLATVVCGYMAEILSICNEDLVVLILDAFTAWYTTFSSDLSPLLPTLLSLLGSDSYSIFTAAAESFTEIYRSYSSSWDAGQRQMLVNTIHQRINAAIIDEDIEAALCRLVIVICEENKVMDGPLIDYLVKLAGKAEPVTEDDIGNDVLEFWSGRVEDIVFDGMSSCMNPVLEGVVASYIVRMQLCEDRVLDDEVLQLRRDFSDFIESSFQLLGPKMIETFVTEVLTLLNSGGMSSIPHNIWLQIEVFIYCLDSVADMVLANSDTQLLLKALFSSSLFNKILTCNDWRVLRTGIGMVGSYGTFLESESGEQFLVPAMQFLFQSLVEPTLQIRASKSIEKLCSSCRSKLTPHISALLSTLAENSSRLSITARIRVISGVAFIISTLGASQIQAEATIHLLKLILSFDILEIEKLRCILSLTKALQLSDEASSSAVREKARQFYANDPFGLRKIVLPIFDIPQVSSDGETCETVCDIFKAGLCERVANPMVFEPEIVVSFLEAMLPKANTSCRPYLISLAAFAASTCAIEKRLDSALATRLVQFADLETPIESLKLILVIVKSSFQVFYSSGRAPEMLNIALASISSDNKFALQAASDFWYVFVALPEFSNIYPEIGPALIRALVLQISGQANRTELVYSSDVIKRLFQKHSLATKLLLEQALLVHPVSEAVSRLDAGVRRTFIEQLVLLRGDRKTADAVKRFWLLSRNIPDY